MLGLAPGDITCHHDIAHSLQLAFSDCIRKNPCEKNITDAIDQAYKLMSEFNCGKKRSEFTEFAAKNSLPTLTPKQKQTTRFVRADMRAMDTFLRDLVTLYQIHGRNLIEAALRGDNNTIEAEYEIQVTLCNGETICRVLGYMCLLQLYCETSLAAQSSFYFPTTVLSKITAMLIKLSELKEKWDWPQEKILIYSG